MVRTHRHIHGPSGPTFEFSGMGKERSQSKADELTRGQNRFLACGANTAADRRVSWLPASTFERPSEARLLKMAARGDHRSRSRSHSDSLSELCLSNTDSVIRRAHQAWSRPSGTHTRELEFPVLYSTHLRLFKWQAEELYCIRQRGRKLCLQGGSRRAHDLQAGSNQERKRKLLW